MNIPHVQKDLSEYLLQRLLEIDEEGSFKATQRGDAATTGQILLNHFRWLDCVVDSHHLTNCFLEVLPGMTVSQQQDAFTILSELSLEDDHEAIFENLFVLINENSELLVPMMEISSNLSLGGDMQLRLIELLLERLCSTEVEKLPEIAKFIFDNADSRQLPDVLKRFRSTFHFVSLCDPRIAIRDGKGKGRTFPPGKEPETLLIESIRQSLHHNKDFAENLLKLEKDLFMQVTDFSPKTLDFWLLMLSASLNANKRNDVHSIIRKMIKVRSFETTWDWILSAIVGHKLVVRHQIFEEILLLAGHLASNMDVCIAKLGGNLFHTIFVELDNTYCQQEVLRNIHSHLGSKSLTEVSVALDILGEIVKERLKDLLKYASFLSMILDYVEGYNSDQLRQLFRIFAELIVGACDCAENESHFDSKFRIENDIFVFLRKQIFSLHLDSQRIGATGIVVLLQRLGCELEDRGETCVSGPIFNELPNEHQARSLLGRRYSEASQLLYSAIKSPTLASCMLPFLCDALALEIEYQRLPNILAKDLVDQLVSVLDSKYFHGIQSSKYSCNNGDNEVWLDLQMHCNINTEDRKYVDFSGKEPLMKGTYFTFEHHPLASYRMDDKSQEMIPIFSIMRAVSRMYVMIHGGLGSLQQVLFYGVCLVPIMETLPHKFVALQPFKQAQVILAIFYGLNWFRELLNSFAISIEKCNGYSKPSTQSLAPKNNENQRSIEAKAVMKMDEAFLARVRACCQLESILAHLLSITASNLNFPELNSMATSKREIEVKSMAIKRKKPSGKGLGPNKSARQRQKKSTDKENILTASHENGSDLHSRQDDKKQTSEDTVVFEDQSASVVSQTMNFEVPENKAELPLEVAEKMRCIHHTTLIALEAVVHKNWKESSLLLAPSAYLISDLILKMKASLPKSNQNPLFLLRKKKPSIYSVPIDSLLEVLQRIIPSLRHLLDIAIAKMEEETNDSAYAISKEATDTEAIDLYMSEPLQDHFAAMQSTEPKGAAAKLILQIVEALNILLSYHSILDSKNLRTLKIALKSFDINGSGAKDETLTGDKFAQDTKREWSSHEWASTCESTCKYLLHLIPSHDEISATPGEIQRWPSILKCIISLLNVGNRLSGQLTHDTREPSTKAMWIKLLSSIRRHIHDSTGRLLRHEWVDWCRSSSCYSPKELVGGGWKGRNIELGEIVAAHIEYSSDPIKEMTRYMSEYLTQVTTSTTGKENSWAFDDLPSLSGSTILVWYKTFWSIFQKQWAKITDAANSLNKKQNEKLKGLDKNKRCHTPEPESIEIIAKGIIECCELFYEMVGLISIQSKRTTLHNHAIKGSSFFLERFIRVIPFLDLGFVSHRDEALDAVKQVQRAARVLHRLCVDGKIRGDVVITSRIPALKRVIEKFVLEAVSFLREKNPSFIISIGELKQRDLDGNALESSQLFPDMETSQEESQIETEDEEYDQSNLSGENIE